MKRILSALLIFALALCFAGCKQDKGRELYNLNLEKYVDLGEYKGLTVDTESEDFKTVSDSIIANDVVNYDLYLIKEEGTVENGDTVNIDFVGKKDGVAFNGGTDEDYDLVIGSGTFIDGFEDGLIGKEIGKTVDLDLTFPENYGDEELNGADVVFTVTINYAKSTTPLEPEEYYTEFGYTKVDEYYENVKQRAIEESLAQAVIEKSEIKDYPEIDLELLYNYYYDTVEANVKSSYQIEMSAYFEAIGQTEDEFKETIIENQIKPLMEQQMLWYLIFDKEKMELTEENTDNKIKEIIAQNGDSSIEKADVIEQFGEYYIENIIVSEKVFEFLKNNAVIA